MSFRLFKRKPSPRRCEGTTEDEWISQVQQENVDDLHEIVTMNGSTVTLTKHLRNRAKRKTTCS